MFRVPKITATQTFLPTKALESAVPQTTPTAIGTRLLQPSVIPAVIGDARGWL